MKLFFLLLTWNYYENINYHFNNELFFIKINMYDEN